MVSNRELAWLNDDLVKRSSVAYQMARYALNLKYQDLPRDVVQMAKRILLDTLTCVIGASNSEGRSIIENMVRELGGTPEATVFGSGLKTNVLNATLLNSFLIRYLDYNANGGGGHNSEALAALFAAAEREDATPEDFLVSLVLSYELGSRIIKAIPGGISGIEAKGWSFDSRAALSMPPAIGRLLGLNEEQIAHAMGISGPFAPTLGIMDTDHVECQMVKDIRFGLGAYKAMMACLLAKGGFSGVVNVIEGEKGFRQIVTGNEMDLHYAVDFSYWYILKDTTFKAYCMNYANNASIKATLDLVCENDIKPQDVASVRVKANARVARHTTLIPGKKYARNAESATHSAFFAVAMAIKERDVGPEQLTPEKFEDPVLLGLIDRITVEEDQTLVGANSRGAIVEIATTEGKRFVKRVDAPPGDISTPFSDADIEEKFRKTASRYMDDRKIETIIQSVWELEKLASIKELTKLLIWD